MKRVLFPIITNLAFLMVVFSWLFVGSDGAHNAAVFLIWLNGLLGILFFICAFSQSALKNAKPPIRFVGWVRSVCETLIVSALVWRGEFLLAAVCLIGWAGAAVFVDVAKKATSAKSCSKRPCAGQKSVG